MQSRPHKLPCGCCTGGCVCAEHGVEKMCNYHFLDEELREDMRRMFQRRCEEELGGENGNAEEYL